MTTRAHSENGLRLRATDVPDLANPMLRILRSQRLLCFLLAGGSAVLSAHPAAAQPSAAEQATSSQSEYRKAHEAARAHKWEEAKAILLRLWAKAKTYDVAASLSEVEYGLGHMAASAQYMDYALRHVTPNESPSTVETMKNALQKIRQKVGAVKVTVSDPGATVGVDGKQMDDLEGEVFLDPGTHTVEARLGERTASKPIEVVAGQAQSLELKLPPVPQPSPNISSVDPVGQTGAPATDVPRSSSHETARTIALVTGGAVALVGLGTGIGFGVASNSSESDMENYRARLGSSGCSTSAPPADCAALREAAESQRRNSHISNVGYGIAAVGLVTVGVALLWPRSRDATNSPTAQLELAWSGTNISLAGKF